MSSLQAAFGRAQLARLDELLERKRQIFGWYEERLADVAGLQLNQRARAPQHLLDGHDGGRRRLRLLDAREMMARFDERQIDTRPFFPPLSSLPAFAGYATVARRRERNPVAYDIAAGRSTCRRR